MIKTRPYANAQEEENNAYWQGPLKSHVFDVPLKTNVPSMVCRRAARCPFSTPTRAGRAMS